jgi:ABC-type polysaccharide/polyol phosphate transport system ATPase subunit
VSFTLREGETLGIIGRNGSGKSTLSMICSGVLIPDEGKIRIQGRSQLLALGVGFKVELSGRENVYISGSLMGLSKKEIESRMEDIEEFAELGEFIDEPVRTYSSGMRSRLGFAVATAVKPDILILDEIMSVGDKAFQEKATQRIRQMRSLARSVIIVSHNPGQLRKLSTRVLWLEKGRMLMLDEPKTVLNAYDNFCKNPAKWLKNNPELASTIPPQQNLT